MEHRCRVLLKRKGWGWLILLFSVAMFAVQSPIQASTSKPSCQVEYINNRLTINVDHVALGRVLTAIREKTGIEFVLSQEQSERLISIRLGSLPMVESLERMLSQFNHAFLFGPDNKPVKVVILGYAKLDSSPRLPEVAEPPSVQRMASPSSAETKDIKQLTKEGSGVRSGEGVISTPSLETKVRERSSGEEMVVTPSTGAMVIHPPPMDMMIITSSETMVVKPASVEMIVTPPNGAMTSLVENMIIRGSTDESKPKVPGD